MLRATIARRASAALPRVLPQRALCTSSPNESVAIPEVERLLLHGIKSIGYDDADAVVMSASPGTGTPGVRAARAERAPSFPRPQRMR